MPKLAPPDFLLRALSRQLGGPSGPFGAVVARMLNKNNGPTIRAAVDALDPAPDATVADIGFGGGIGLDVLLDRVPRGRVHGVEPAADMLARASRQRSEPVGAGRLVLHEARMDALPFAAGELDGWISLNTIYFVDDLAPAFAELARVLSPTGRGVLGIADPDWMGDQPFTRHNFTLRPVDEVVGALRGSGLSVADRPPGEGGGPPFHLLVCRPGG